jgi:hypothetical protein
MKVYASELSLFCISVYDTYVSCIERIVVYIECLSRAEMLSHKSLYLCSYYESYNHIKEILVIYMVSQFYIIKSLCSIVFHSYPDLVFYFQEFHK